MYPRPTPLTKPYIVFRMCATVPEPVANNGIIIMVPCGTAANQLWNFSKDMFSGSAPNASAAFMLPTHPDTPEGWGWTYTLPVPKTGEKLVLYDIGNRFRGECKGHHNCNFSPSLNKDGQLTTYSTKLQHYYLQRSIVNLLENADGVSSQEGSSTLPPSSFFSC